MLRARTRAGRLAALDRWLAHEQAALQASGATLVDFGFGESPVTTEEWARSAPQCRVVGVDYRESRSELVTLKRGGVELCAQLAPTAIVRAMNVVRSYREDEVAALHEALGAGVVEGGLVIEGSTDTDGAVLCAWLLRKAGGRLVKESLLTWTDFSRGFSPWLFRDWLPRELRRNVKPGTAIYQALTRWAARCTGETPRARYLASLSGEVHATPWEVEGGYARLRVEHTCAR